MKIFSGIQTKSMCTNSLLAEQLPRFRVPYAKFLLYLFNLIMPCHKITQL